VTATADVVTRDDGSELIALLTPTGRDGPVAMRVLADAGLGAVACPDMAALCALVGDGDGVGAVLVAEEALGPRSSGMLLQVLGAQAPWSDVPIVVLTGEDELSRAIPVLLEELASHANVTLLERPVRVATIVTVMRSALRARRRQYDVRAHLVERKLLLERERSARHQAEEANHAKSEFLAMMSHELRTPLNAIGGYAQLMEMGLRGPITPEQREDLERIERSQRHLLGLINDVLNFAKLEAGHVEFETTHVPLHESLSAMEGLVMPQLIDRSLHYEYTPVDPTLTVFVDREKLQQVVLNLLANAIKYTGNNGSIELSATDAGDFALIHVRDTGRGIPADKFERIFEPFVRIDTGYSRPTEGTGLGLAISRDLARAMGGDLTVASAVAEGSTFTLKLPKRPPV
jgi:signal transduction histidine kinase